jgi:hypothetical protein
MQRLAAQSKLSSLLRVQKAMSAVACYWSGTPIAEVPFAVSVSVSPKNVSAHSILHGDKQLSQNPELACWYT